MYSITPFNAELLSSINEHMLKCYPEEGVGYVTDGIFYPVQNLAKDKVNTFACVFKEEADIWVHSHTVGHTVASPDYDPRSPSYEDLLGQKATGKEWALIVTDGVTCNPPLYWGNPRNRPPLIGRDFIFNIQDCFSLAQDYYFQEHGIILDTVPRTPFWNEEGENHIIENFERLGFEQVPLNKVQVGDALIYQVRSQVPNHIGIYYQPDKVLSHWYNRVSQVEDYGLWARYIVLALRYTKEQLQC